MEVILKVNICCLLSKNELQTQDHSGVLKTTCEHSRASMNTHESLCALIVMVPGCYAWYGCHGAMLMMFIKAHECCWGPETTFMCAHGCLWVLMNDHKHSWVWHYGTNVQDGMSSPLGSWDIHKPKVYTVLLDPLYYINPNYPVGEGGSNYHPLSENNDCSET